VTAGAEGERSAVGVDAATTSFLERWRGPAPTGRRLAVLEAALGDALERARASWPRVSVAPARFGAWLGARAPVNSPADEAVRLLRAEPLYLACACAQGIGEAVASFDEALLSHVPGWIAQFGLDRDGVEEAKQILREKLFVGGADGAPKIEQYGGRGSLESWLRVAAVRTALNVLAARKPTAALDEGREVSEGVLQYDVELDYIKARHRADFAEVFGQALSALPKRDRALLRFHYLERLTPARIGTIYRVHRTTAARWIAEAQRRLLEDTRRRLMGRLGISRAECDSLVRAVRSRLPVTLGSFLRAQVA
jgi:RNA polymerase sigma-70 factor (ECF subfamily)